MKRRKNGGRRVQLYRDVERESRSRSRTRESGLIGREMVNAPTGLLRTIIQEDQVARGIRIKPNDLPFRGKNVRSSGPEQCYLMV
jgi:hypothetical protein